MNLFQQSARKQLIEVRVAVCLWPTDTHWFDLLLFGILSMARLEPVLLGQVFVSVLDQDRIGTGLKLCGLFLTV